MKTPHEIKVLGLSQNSQRVLKIIQDSGARDVVTVNFLADEVELGEDDVKFCLMALERRGLIDVNGSSIDLH